MIDGTREEGRPTRTSRVQPSAPSGTVRPRGEEGDWEELTGCPSSSRGPEPQGEEPLAAEMVSAKHRRSSILHDGTKRPSLTRILSATFLQGNPGSPRPNIVLIDRHDRGLDFYKDSTDDPDPRTIPEWAGPAPRERSRRRPCLVQDNDAALGRRTQNNFAALG